MEGGQEVVVGRTSLILVMIIFFITNGVSNQTASQKTESANNKRSETFRDCLNCQPEATQSPTNTTFTDSHMRKKLLATSPLRLLSLMMTHTTVNSSSIRGDHNAKSPGSSTNGKGNDLCCRGSWLPRVTFLATFVSQRLKQLTDCPTDGGVAEHQQNTSLVVGSSRVLPRIAIKRECSNSNPNYIA